MVKPSKRANRPLLILMVATMAVAAILVVVMWRVVASGPRDGGFTAAADIGGSYSLVDQTGAPVTDKTYLGKYQLLYFGYTFCPDACPTELQVIGQAIDLLGPEGDKVQPIFVTIDPERDTPRQLADYVPQFHKRLVGLTGTPEQIAAIARAYKVYYAKAPMKDGAYAMNHSSYVYLMDPGGKFLTVFGSDLDAEKLAAELRRYIGGSTSPSGPS